MIAPAAPVTLAQEAEAPVEPGVWQRVALVEEESLAAGMIYGGENGQQPQGMAIDATDGSFLLLGTDVGGVFRSVDGATTWEPANVGHLARGSSGFAIDPNNPRRALSIGANSKVDETYHGLYLSTDQASSWRQVLTHTMSGHRDVRRQLAFDPSSYDPALGLTTEVYWSTLAREHPKARYADRYTPRPTVYKSSDGGESWVALPGSSQASGGSLAVHPTRRGVIYTANRNGVFRSEDKGTTFTLLREGIFTGLAVSKARPDWVWAQQARELWLSRDAGQTWSSVPMSAGAARADATNRDLAASPVDANRLIYWQLEDEGHDWARYVTDDGGNTWNRSLFREGHLFSPYNYRYGLFAWHPLEAATVFATGGDPPFRSDDGGRTFAYAGDGITGVALTEQFQFNPHVPEVIYLGAQDDNGGYSTDGGKTWRYLNASGYNWGGHAYGAFGIDPHTFATGTSRNRKNPRTLRVYHGHGDRWRDYPEITWHDKADAFNGYSIGCADPLDPDIAFIAGYRSTDRGKTWQPMTGCHGVFAYAPAPVGTLAGLDQRDGSTDLVTSDDHGVTWKAVATVRQTVADLAIHPDGKTLFYVDRLGLHRVNPDGSTVHIPTPSDRDGGAKTQLITVAIDPVVPEVMYVGRRGKNGVASPAVMRSVDRGMNWEALTVDRPLDGVIIDGARETECIRVHPVTREAWASTSCYGVWKIAPPAESTTPR